MKRRAIVFLRWLWGADEEVGAWSLVKSTPAVWVILAVIIVVSVVDFALPEVMGADLLTHYLGDSTARIARGEVWRLLTPELVNPPFFGKRYITGAEHLIANIFGLVLAGIHIERALGRRRLIVLYVIAGLASQVALFTALPVRWGASGGSSGSVNGLYGALVVIALAERRQSRGKFKYFVASWAAVTLAWLGGFLNTSTTNIIHLGGFLGGMLLAVAWVARPAHAARAGLAVSLAIVLVSALLVVPKSAHAREVDPAVLTTVPLGMREPSLTESAFGSLWVTGNGLGVIARVDPHTREVVGVIRSPKITGGMAAADRSLWVAGNHSVVEIDPTRNRAVSSVSVPGEGPWGLSAAGGTLWAALPDKGSIARIDLKSRKVGLTRVGQRPYSVLANSEGVWATSFEGRRVSRLDPASGRVLADLRLRDYPYSLEFADGSVWVGTQRYVYRLHPTRLTIAAKVELRENVWAMSADASGQIWVSERNGFELSQIDAKTNKVVRRVRVGLGQPYGVAAALDRVWVSDSFRRALLEIEP